MKVDVSSFRKRPTFDEVAQIVNADKYKINLPQRTYIRWEDTHAQVQFENLRDAIGEAEALRVRRQAVEAQVMPPPPARVRGRDRSPTPGPRQTTLTGEVQSEPEPQTSVKGKIDND